MPETAKVEASASLGAAFADALGAKDFDRIRDLLHPELDFRGLTPNRNWEASDPDEMVASVRKLAHKVAANPAVFLEQEVALVPELASVMAGRSELAPAAGDKRFQDEAWRSNPFYRRTAQSYLAWCGALTTVAAAQ